MALTVEMSQDDIPTQIDLIHKEPGGFDLTFKHIHNQYVGFLTDYIAVDTLAMDKPLTVETIYL